MMSWELRRYLLKAGAVSWQMLAESGALTLHDAAYSHFAHDIQQPRHIASTTYLRSHGGTSVASKQALTCFSVSVSALHSCAHAIDGLPCRPQHHS